MCSEACTFAKRSTTLSRPACCGRPSPRRRALKRVDPNADLVLTIDRGWGDQKVFSYYRAALTAVHRERGETLEIARFREANAELETRLRAKLPDRMAEIDFLYGHASAALRQNPG